jgi:hypothetical protein
MRTEERSDHDYGDDYGLPAALRRRQMDDWGGASHERHFR